jgi:Flp pilus assembly protein TadD
MQLLNTYMQGEVQRWLGDEEKSRAAFERARGLAEEALKERPDDPILTGNLAIALAGLGRKAEAVSVAQRSIELIPLSRDSIDGVNCIVALAEVHALNGDPTAAVNELAKIADLPNGPTYAELRYNPLWDEARKDPRFEKLIAAAAVPPKFE